MAEKKAPDTSASRAMKNSTGLRLKENWQKNRCKTDIGKKEPIYHGTKLRCPKSTDRPTDKKTLPDKTYPEQKTWQSTIQHIGAFSRAKKNPRTEK